MCIFSDVMVIFAMSLWVLRLMLQPFSKSMGDRGSLLLVSMCRCLPREVWHWCFPSPQAWALAGAIFIGFPVTFHLLLLRYQLQPGSGPYHPKGTRGIQRAVVFQTVTAVERGVTSGNLRAEAATGVAEVTGSGAGLKTMTLSSVWAIFNFGACWEDACIW